MRNTIRRLGRRLGLPVGHRLLDGDRAGDRVDHGRKLDDRPVAHQLDDPALVLGERADRSRSSRRLLDRGQRAGLVLLDQPRVADDVRGQDRRQPPLGARGGAVVSAGTTSAASR